MMYKWLTVALRTRPNIVIRRLPCPLPFKLIDLPIHYVDLFSMFVETTCRKCSQVPQEPAICLVCGKLVCMANACCKVEEKGECTQHAEECGGGIGIFLILKHSYILMLRDGGGCYWGSVYLDQHGEEDPGLKRGKPLTLSPPRYEQLRQVWISKTVEQACLKKGFWNRIPWGGH